MMIRRKLLSVLLLMAIFSVFALPVVLDFSTCSSKYISMAFAEDEEEEEEAVLDPADLIKEGYVRFPEIAQNPENPNVDFAKDLEIYDVPIGKFGLFGLSNRDITWIIAQLHILFASFILACPMFIIVSEACGSEKTPGVRRACAFIAILAGIFGGSVIGMIGEVVVGVHHAVELGGMGRSYSSRSSLCYGSVRQYY